MGRGLGPEAPPDKVVRGEKKKSGKGTVVSFAGAEVKWIGFVDRLQTLEGLANEYQLRKSEVEALEGWEWATR